MSPGLGHLAPVLAVLAAGESRRLRECKALVDLGGRTALERLLAAGSVVPGPPLVVVGADADDNRATLPPGVEVVVNERWIEGRSGSVRLAFSARPGRDTIVAPIDVPLVSQSVFEALLAEWDRAGAPAHGWLAPATNGDGLRPGHPVMIGRNLLPELFLWDPDTPLSRLRGMAHPLWMVEVDDPAIHDDLDTIEDLKRLRDRGFDRA